MEPGKLFIGGTSWDTNEEKLKEYFETYGEVVEAVIMKDRATGRARGFGFVVFADPFVADRVVRLKHIIDGRTVEAKKAVPRDDQHIVNRNSSSPVPSPVPARTKKIFVGGLASTVTEGDFKRYFSQFGTITDVVVMYDHNTQRPRGFGFITYDSEEAVERALIKSFHELNGKMVEVKPAVPKELSPGPTRSPLGVGTTGFNRLNGFLNGFPHLFNPVPIGSHGMKLDERLTPIPFVRSGFPSSGPSSYGSGLNYEPRISPSCNETVNMLPKLNFEQGLNALNSSYVARHGHLFEYEEGNRGTASNLGSSSWSLWGNGNIGDNTVAANGAHVSFRGGNIEQDTLKNTEAIWGSTPISVQSGARSLSNGPSLNYGREALNVGSVTGFYGRDVGARAALASSSASRDVGFDSKFDDLYTGGGGGQSWASESLGLKGSGSFDFGLGNVVSDVSLNNPARLCW